MRKFKAVVLVWAALVIAAQPAAAAISLKKLAANLKKHGRAYTVPDAVAAELALARNVPALYEEVDDSQTQDGTYRVVFLYGAPKKPEGFIFMTKRIKNYRYETFYARTDMEGNAKAGMVEYGEIYPDGTSSREKPVTKRFIGTDAVLIERLATEMGFWLEGRKRRKRVDPFDQPF